MTEDRQAWQGESTTAWIWLGLPLLLYLGHYLARWVLSEAQWDRWVLHEFGFTEQATVLLLVLALLAGLRVVQLAWREGRSGLAGFFLLFCLGCLYFGGEEASWGQHWFGWSAPEAWEAVNLQEETNLHNLEGTRGWLLNKLPRNLLTLGIAIGGVLLPLVLHRRGAQLRPEAFWGRVLPGLRCVPAGLVVLLSTLPQKLAIGLSGSLPWWLDITEGEVKELMIAAFLLIYILLTRSRWRAAA